MRSISSSPEKNLFARNSMWSHGIAIDWTVWFCGHAGAKVSGGILALGPLGTLMAETAVSFRRDPASMGSLAIPIRLQPPGGINALPRALFAVAALSTLAGSLGMRRISPAHALMK